MNKLFSLAMAITLLVPVAAAWAQQKRCPEEAAACAHRMAAHYKDRGWAGINLQHDEEKGTVAITAVVPDSPAESAGLRQGDILRSLNGVDYSEQNEAVLKEQYESFRPGATVTFVVERRGQRIGIEVLLERLPDAVLAQWVGSHVLEHHPPDEEARTDEDEGTGETP